MAKKSAEERKEEARVKKLGDSKKVSDYTLPSDAKFKRIKQAMPNATGAALLAEYDKQGGLILKEEKGEYRVVPTGTFYDFDKKAPKVKEEKKEDKEDKEDDKKESKEK